MIANSLAKTEIHPLFQPSSISLGSIFIEKHTFSTPLRTYLQINNTVAIVEKLRLMNFGCVYLSKKWECSHLQPTHVANERWVRPRLQIRCSTHSWWRHQWCLMIAGALHFSIVLPTCPHFTYRWPWPFQRLTSRQRLDCWYWRWMPGRSN